MPAFRSFKFRIDDTVFECVKVKEARICGFEHSSVASLLGHGNLLFDLVLCFANAVHASRCSRSLIFLALSERTRSFLN